MVLQKQLRLKRQMYFVEMKGKFNSLFNDSLETKTITDHSVLKVIDTNRIQASVN